MRPYEDSDPIHFKCGRLLPKLKNRFSTLSNRQRIYLAGFLDGEGYFGVGKKGTRTYSPAVEVHQSGYRAAVLMDELHELLGGSLDHSSQKPWYKGDNRHPVSRRLRWSGATARELCEVLLPYLRFKSPQAQLLVDWPLRRSGRVSDKVKQQNQAILEEQESVYLQIKDLNTQK